MFPSILRQTSPLFSSTRLARSPRRVVTRLDHGVLAVGYSGFDLGETVDVRMDSFAGETETVDRTGKGLGSISKLWAGDHRGLERLLLERSGQFSPVLFRFHRFETG